MNIKDTSGHESAAQTHWLWSDSSRQRMICAASSAWATESFLGVHNGWHNAQTVRLLRPIRSQSHRFGGSHAQRDLIDLTLIDLTLIRPAELGGEQRLADALHAER